MFVGLHGLNSGSQFAGLFAIHLSAHLIQFDVFVDGIV